ncbi:c-type cytochrome [Bradyrhizobium erythrophlei]|uniref:Cytochrome c, mono-and diheme variants n=1 Tax=Bradyrhizobium erythrophlei TaxID=1437360 RepID=A0A1M7UNB1_9BRAD|nr:cytochrome c [Bradyrhizobium erythrophlei]SHN84469.1 Cytochrome c, mono-and diheme variants [Bradyrhizobium erythrophlei]
MRRPLTAAILFVSLTGTVAAQDFQSFDLIERGRYLAILGDCAGCHTAANGAPFAGGVALLTPFGTLVAPNITSDPDTGIGNMTNDEFLAALREGRGRNGKRLYPAMPYPAYTKMADDDVRALRAYFATIAPVKNRVESNQLPFPLNIRLAMVFWNGLNFTPGRYQPNPQKSAAWNRGAYIVEGPAHCGTCHTPKTLLGGDKNSAALTGATLQGWFAPDITNDQRKGIGGWSQDDLVQYLKTGANKWTLASGPMAEAVSHSTSRMNDEDILAIATYLKDNGQLGASARPEPVAAGNGAMRAGAAIYKDSCAACHKDSGEGEINLFPRLAGSALVQSDDPTTLARVVLHGTRAVSTSGAPTAPAMPAFDWRLEDVQVAAVLTYIRNTWGNAAGSVPASAVAGQRASLAKSP